jgi:uncharacterized integral membrane protein
MNEAVARWRLSLFRAGLVLMAIEFALYLCAVVSVQTIEPLGPKLKAAGWFFVIGSGLSLIVIILSMFGYGWKRIGLAVMCLLSVPFWFGFTLY